MIGFQLVDFLASQCTSSLGSYSVCFGSLMAFEQALVTPSEQTQQRWAHSEKAEERNLWFLFHHPQPLGSVSRYPVRTQQGTGRRLPQPAMQMEMFPITAPSAAPQRKHKSITVHVYALEAHGWVCSITKSLKARFASRFPLPHITKSDEMWQTLAACLIFLKLRFKFGPKGLILKPLLFKLSRCVGLMKCAELQMLREPFNLHSSSSCLCLGFGLLDPPHRMEAKSE